MGIAQIAKQAGSAVARTTARILDIEEHPLWDFTPQKMVAWFAPKTLTNAAIRALLTSTTGQYGDRRDCQATLSENKPYSWDKFENLGIDFVADTGDGFHSTFAVARTMAEDSLPVDGDTGAPRGKLILLGGDQVYPDAHDNAYANRLVGPYEAAFAHVGDEPAAFAIPGNHDWYDGLFEFMTLFCGSDEHGAFRPILTPQERSYWAIELPGNWMCLGLDWHIGVTMDISQREYFREIVGKCDAPKRFMLVVPNPVWIQYFHGQEEHFETLCRFIDDILDSGGGHSVEVILTGDLHCYARYDLDYREMTIRLVMAGGGGAYFYPTHGLPRVTRSTTNDDPVEMKTDRRHSSDTASLTVQAVYPPPAESAKMAGKALSLPALNPALAFMFIGPLYLLLNYIFRSADSEPGVPNEWPVWSTAEFTWNSLRDSILTFWHSAYTLTGVITAVAVIVGMGAWAHSAQAANDRKVPFMGAGAFVIGALHGLLHLALASICVWLVAASRNTLGQGWPVTIIDLLFMLVVIVVAIRYKLPKPVIAALVLVEVLVSFGLLYLHLGADVSEAVRAQIRIPLLSQWAILVGGVIGTTVLGIYLYSADRLGGHPNDSLACRSSARFKNFLRMRVGASGALDLIAFGIDDSPHQEDWTRRNGRYELEDGDVGELAKVVDRTSVPPWPDARPPAFE